MVLNIEHSQKIITPEIPGYYYSRDRLIEKVLSYKSKRLILITAPAGYGKTTFSVEFFHRLKREIRLWISISPYDNSIENFFLLLAIAFENNLPNSKFGSKLKNILSKSQNVSLNEKINNVISSFSSDLYSYAKEKKRQIYIFLDDFHNIDESDEVCSALNYFLEYLPANVNFVIISRRDPKKINYPKFLAKNWLGRIMKSDLLFDDTEIENFIKIHKKKTANLDKDLLEDFLKTTEGWVTAIQLLLMTKDFGMLKAEDFNLGRKEIFEYFTKEIYENCSEEEKILMLKLSYPESFDKNIIENVMKIENGYDTLIKLYESNVFINKEDGTFRFHELLRRFLNRLADEKFSKDEISSIYRSLGNYYLRSNDWREDYIALNYLIIGRDYETLKQWIKLNASDKLLLIHSSGLFKKIEEIADEKFILSLEYILLRVNTLIYKDKDVTKAIDYLRNIILLKYSTGYNDEILIPVNKIKESEVNYYVELLMLICNCNFLKEGIGTGNIPISEHILKFRLKVDQEIQFIVSLIKSYITTGENSKSRKYIGRLKEIFYDVTLNQNLGKGRIEENSLVESAFSMLIFFDYGDYKTGNKVVKYIENNFDFRNFDLSNYSQMCFALFTSYNLSEFEYFFNFLKEKNKEKDQTIFSAYKNQYEFQSILRKFLNYDFKQVIRDFEILKKNTYQQNYIYFIDSLIMYCYNLTEQPLVLNRLLKDEDYKISKTRLIILQLEASLLARDLKLYRQTMEEVNSIKRENFTIFNQAVIFFCESYYYAITDEFKKFKDKFNRLLNLCIEFEYDNYLCFRAKANKMNYIFTYAVEKNIESIYLKKLFAENCISLSKIKKHSINIRVEFLNDNKIYVNGTELLNSHWQRAKSKYIFLYMVYKAYTGNDVTKESLIDDILYNSKNVNYEAIADVEINKVRKTLQAFISDLLSEKIDKDILIIRDKKYFITSKNVEVNYQLDVEEFKRLSSSKNISDKLSAFEIYKTDFAKDSYQTWAEDIRENLKFIYSETIHSLVSYYEKKEDNKIVMRLLEKLVDMDYSDEEIMMKLLSVYNKEKDFRKFKFVYKIYEKRLKKDFNVQPSEEMKKYFSNILQNS
ncbi:MAG: AAA family ATPase [Ignavibacteria bacterium]|nr:AAA family ATPase [Ignavibacteria bacterium]